MASWDLEPLPTYRPRRPIRAGRYPSARLLVLCAAAVVAVLAAAAGAQSAPGRRLDSPQLSQIARASGPIPDSELSRQGISRLVPGAYWGGVYRTASGESVTVFPAPQAQIGRVCGADALACYSGQDSVLVAPGEDPTSDISAEAVITHEYGHHVAGHRSDAPWSALDYGTKRWASYIQVCAKARQGQLFPGAEEAPRYQLNPGEGFAESYRVLNERKAGLTETPWQVVSDSLYPDNTALTLLEQDVTTPWQGVTTTTRSGSLTRTTRVRTFTVPTQLDGTLRVSLRPSGGTRLALDVYASSTRLVHAVGARAFSRTTTICGERNLRIRVSAVSGNGTFRLTVAKP